jgi:hypothetical protein
MRAATASGAMSAASPFSALRTEQSRGSRAGQRSAPRAPDQSSRKCPGRISGSTLCIRPIHFSRAIASRAQKTDPNGELRHVHADRHRLPRRVVARQALPPLVEPAVFVEQADALE